MPAPAKLTDRFLAYLIDTFPFWIGFYLTANALGVNRGAAALGWLLAYVAYHAVGNARGATVGKRVLGLRVVGLDGAPLPPARCLVRAAGLVASTPLCNLGFLWAFVSPQSRAFHDLLASSQVVEAAPASERKTLITAALAALSLGGMLTLVLWAGVFRQTPEDAAAVERAHEGLRILAQIEEQYRVAHGKYTNQLSDLAEQSGDVGDFVRSMGAIFEPNQFYIKASRGRFLLRARAKDSRRTVVTLSSAGRP